MTWHSPQATTHDLAYLQDAAAGATPPFRPRPAPRPPSRTTAVIPTPQLCNQRLSNAPFHFDARRPRPPPTWTPAMQSAPQQRPPSISTRAGPARRRPGPQLRLQRLSNALHSNFLISPRCPQHAPRAPNHPPSAPTWLLSVVCCCALYVSLYDSLNLN